MLKPLEMTKGRRQEFLELLSNEEFKRWVLEPTYESDVFWTKWIENHPEKRDIVYAATEFIRRKKFSEFTFSPKEKDQILSSIISKTTINPLKYDDHKSSQNDGSERSIKSYGKWLYKAAAILFFIATFSGIIVWNLNNSNTQEDTGASTFVKKENPQGRKSVVMLPDGTKVVLNSASALTYDSNFGEQDRNVHLEGEAFFDVKPDADHPFRVVSKDVITTALGTSFNVRYFENESSLNISLLSGMVKVALVDEDNSADEHFLNPGEGFVITRQSGEMQKVTIDEMKDFGWKDGILVFKGHDLAEVVNTLERWYDVHIKVIGQPEKSWRADGKFDNETLEQVLQGLSFTYDMEFLINKNYVELKFN